MEDVVLLLGGNIGDVRGTFDIASRAIERGIGKITRTSALYTSEAWGFTCDKKFTNQALLVDTPLAARDVLGQCLEIEAKLGRKRENSSGYESRLIDIDILFYKSEIITAPDLVVPHPRLHLRRFALMPLCELAPTFVHPVLRETLRELLERCPDAGSCQEEES